MVFFLDPGELAGWEKNSKSSVVKYDSCDLKYWTGYLFTFWATKQLEEKSIQISYMESADSVIRSKLGDNWEPSGTWEE